MNKIITLINSFPIFVAIKILLFLFLRKILSLDIRFTYSQTGEDAILESFFGIERKLFYVDVGCNDPINCSNTLLMYINGGNGICIDPNNKLMKKFSKIRPRDIVIDCAVSDVEQEVAYYISDDSLINTINKGTVEKDLSEYTYSNTKYIQTRTLDSILEENLPENQIINVLSIDVEGHDINVLKSVNLNIYRPELIIVEIHGLSLNGRQFENNEILIYLKNLDYKLKYYATMNAYFIDERTDII